jgi:DNA modification methylase
MTPYYADDHVTLYHARWEDVPPDLLRADVLVTDPPYGIGAAKGNAHSSIRDAAAWPAEEWDDERVAESVARLVGMHGAAAIWGGNYYADVLPASSGWLAWVKPEAETGFSLADMELCWTSLPMAARVKRWARRDGNLHPTQKPVDVIAWTLSFMPPGTILDPYAGSGTTLVAAKSLGRKAIGVECVERYCEVAANRLRQEVLGLAA